MSGNPAGSVRIIGGVWRGRRLKFPAGTEVRPTPDRIRETVFNWLGFALAGADCLDLFAGTGAFGFEALSRGAASATFVESNRRLAGALEASREALGAANATVVCAAVESWIDAQARASAGRQRFAFIALDPPYRTDVVPLLGALGGVLAAGGSIYVERPAAAGLPEVEGMRWHRRSRAGRVEFGLAVAD